MRTTLRRTLVVGGAVAFAVALAKSTVHGLRELGSTPAERSARLPGDEIIPDPSVVADHGISIEAHRDHIWPWLKQIGQDKAGSYSFQVLQNAVGLAMENADRINPDWQDLKVGDVVRIGAELGLRVVQLDEGRTLVLSSADAVGREEPPVQDPGFDFTWTFHLIPEPGGTRLVTRERYLGRTWPGRFWAHLGSLMSGAMTTRMLRGIDERVMRIG